MILQSQPGEAGAWVLLSAPAGLLALPADEAARRLDAAARLAGPDGFRATLELLTADGIAAAPAFALLDGDASVARVVLRGAASVTVTGSDPRDTGGDVADLSISGLGMSTWSERVLEGVRSLRLQVPGSTWVVVLDAAPAAAPSSPAVEARVEARVEPRVEPVETHPVETGAVGETTWVPSTDTASGGASTPQPESESEPDSAPFAYDFLFGDTIYRTQAGVSVRIPNPDPEQPGDHDGRTVLAAELADELATELGPPAPAPVSNELTVVAPIPGFVPGAVGPTTAPSGPTAAPAVPVFHLERADGRREALDGAVLIGRAPSAGTGPASGPRTRLITIPDDQDISRSHVRVAVEGDAVVVTDLASKNGTVITLPGGAPRKLRGGEPAVVLAGTLIDLGGGVTFTVREE